MENVMEMEMEDGDLDGRGDVDGNEEIDECILYCKMYTIQHAGPKEEIRKTSQNSEIFFSLFCVLHLKNDEHQTTAYFKSIFL